MGFERIIELIVLLMMELQNSSELGIKELEKFSTLGYTSSEINSACGWIFSKLGKDNKVFSKIENTFRSHRFLDRIEEKAISPEALGYLIQIRELGIVNDFDVELLIEKLMNTGYRYISVEEMKQFISLYLMEQDDMKSNKRITINIKDTVN
jgi:uncharacterized protein Smg (DUF494 family)